MSAELDTAAIRARLDASLAHDLWHPALDDVDALLAENERLRARAEAAEAALEVGDACGAVGCRALSERDEAIAALERVRALAKVLKGRAEMLNDRNHYSSTADGRERNTWILAERELLAALDGAHPTPSDGSGTDG